MEEKEKESEGEEEEGGRNRQMYNINQRKSVNPLPMMMV